ncbi:type II secretion system protein N [Marinobacter sp. HN1S83]|uniref:type II secretion system protein N n=1 Tax=Marinobacter sp. HN1S83 TaxID=3382301 RepID=UPI00387AE9E0
MAALSFQGQARIARLLANLLLLLLVVYLAVTLARVTWLVLWDEQPFVASAGVEAGSPGRGNASLDTPISNYELFGRPRGENRVAEVVRRSAPETGLKLRLEGVMLAERPEDSGAIVAGSNGETEHYRVGDALPGNAELVEVEPGRILIRRNGRYESLAFEEQTGGDALVADEPQEPAESPDQFLADARDKLDSQGAAALAAYGLSPTDGSGSGGYVYDGSNAMLNAVNLRAGDVITAVNGQRLGDIEQDKSLLDSWRTEPQLEIEIERNGSTLTVSYAIPEQWR